jgi:ethanolamine utilization microcompartment shell protein EutS
MNFQDILHEVYDGTNKALKTVGSAAAGQVTVSPVQAWPDPKTYIGLVTITGSVGFAGNVTLDPGSKTQIVGNVTLSDSKTYIGLVTATLGNPNVGILGNVTLTDSKTNIGLVTLTGGTAWADPKAFIGLVTVGNQPNVAVIGNVTISDSKGYIGLVTNTPAYGSNSTVYTGIISGTGNTTILTAPASNRFFIKNIHISSLGRSELEIRSGATTLIPFTALATTSGYAEHFGEMGLPGRAQADALVINLNGGATISYMFNVRFEA